MPEGVAEADGGVVDVGAGERGRPPKPADDPVMAPKGWRWDSKKRDWVPAKRVTRRTDDGPDPAWADAGDDGWRADRDPDPAHLDDGGSRKGSDKDRDRPPSGSLSEEDADDLQAVLALAGALMLPTVARIDPVCGGAAVDSWDKVSEKLVPIIARSKSMTEWATKAGGLRDWLGLAAALQPVGEAVLRHHVFHTIHADDDVADGELVDEDFSAYRA